MAISPGIILIPSNMITLKDKIDGYNNILTVGKSGMGFGENSDVNYSEPESDTVLSTRSSEDKVTIPVKK